jgi:hypothetical protein
MRIKYRATLPWIAAVLALALPISPAAWAVSSSAAASKLINSSLPAGVTLRRASIDLVADALYTTTSQHPDMAMSLLRVAVVAKSANYKDANLPCPDLIKMLRKTVAAVPDQARQLLELALSLDPACTDALNDIIADPTLLGLPFNALGGFGVVTGFGAGLGGDFPGAPGFTGSPPGGATALPPSVVNPLTNDANG